MATTEITFDKLLYIDRLKSAGVAEQHAHAHAAALDQALHCKVVAKHDLGPEISHRRQEARDFRDLRTETRDLEARLVLLGDKFETKIALAVLDIKIFSAGITIVAFGALVLTKFLH